MTRAESDHLHRDVGAAEALGLVIIFPVIVLLAVLIVAMGRDIDSAAQARSAAQAGAQAAALQRSPAAAERAMRDVVARMLDSSTSCTNSSAALAWEQPVAGAAGLATVSLTCTRPARGLEALDIADAVFTVSAIAAIDPLRASESSDGAMTP